MDPLPALAPQEAIAFFRGKGLLESFAWPDVWQEEHAKAFTVAKAMRRDILQDIYEAVDRALADGTTLETFRRELTPLLQAKGWWGRQEATDPLTGEIRNVQLGAPRRLETIFDVNLRSAYQAGRWQRIERTKAALPFLRYVAVGGKAGDGRTRLQHRAWHGTTLPVGHPWWDTHYGPCGWRCRCTAQQLTLGQYQRLKARGVEVTETPVQFPPRRWKNPRTGEVIVVETGIDPGFSYNVGKAYLRGITPSPTSPPISGEGRSVNADRHSRPALEDDLLPVGVGQDEAIAAFFDGFDLAPGRGRIWSDVQEEPIALEAGLFLDAASKPVALRPELLRALPLIGRTLRDPDEIWWTWTHAGDGGAARLERVWLATWDVGGRVVEAAIGVSARGWWAATSIDPAGSTLSSLRPSNPTQGVVTWRRPAN